MQSSSIKDRVERKNDRERKREKRGNKEDCSFLELSWRGFHWAFQNQSRTFLRWVPLGLLELSLGGFRGALKSRERVLCMIGCCVKQRKASVHLHMSYGVFPEAFLFRLLARVRWCGRQVKVNKKTVFKYFANIHHQCVRIRPLCSGVVMLGFLFACLLVRLVWDRKLPVSECVFS